VCAKAVRPACSLELPLMSKLEPGRVLAEAHALFRAGRVDAAIERLEGATRSIGADAVLWANLALAYDAAGRRDAAARARAEAVALAPADPAILANLAGAQLDAGQSVESEATARRALALDGRLWLAWFHLALALQAQRRNAEALAAARQALAFAPNEIGPAGLTAQLAQAAGQPDLARATIAAALARHPRTPALLAQQAAIAERERDLATVVRAQAELLALEPDNGPALSGLIFARKSLADWHKLPELQARFRAGVERGAAWLTPFSFLSDASTRAEQRRCAESWSAGFAPRQMLPPPRAPRSSGERLRIGYLSTDFFEHPTALLVAGVLEHHDRSRFRVYGYSTGPDDGSALRRRVQAACHRFVDARGWPPGRLAQRIREDGVDVLIDLKGHTDGAPLAVLALRPAPVQAHWVGYPGTLGAPFIDYLIADAVVAPPEHAADYTETLVRLPGCYQPNDRSRAAAAAPSREALGLPPAATVLCAFNASWKINAEVLAAWARILAACPGSVLWLLVRGADDPAAANLRAQAHAAGIGAQRLVFATYRPMHEYLALYRHADLMLDTWPYNAHTTASDALWMGCPLVTWTGETFAGRVATSLVTALGVPELAARDVDGYVVRAIDLARDAQQRALLRERVATGVTNSRVFDASAHARAIERACVAMVEQVRRGVRAPIDIAE
jgi:protein O-GlcNAc transferase